MNTNTAILHALLDRGVYLENWTQAELAKILPVLESANERVLGKIAATKGEWTKAWLVDMKADLDEIYGSAASEIEKRLMSDLEALASEEVQDIEATWGKVLAGVSTTAPAAAQLWATIKALPVSEGSTLGNLMQTMGVSASSQVVSAIQEGILAGDTTQQMVQRLRGSVVSRARWGKKDGKDVYIPGVYEGGVMDGATTKSAEMLARTATMHVGNQAREAFYAQNSDIIKGYQAVATLDLDTCLICGELDGKIYGPDEPRPQYPLHPRCRCLYTVVLKSFRELGFDAKDLPPATRASMDGQVSEFVTFADRLKAMSPAKRIEVMGKSRAALYDRGVLLQDMVKDGKLVPLKDLVKTKKGKAA